MLIRGNRISFGCFPPKKVTGQREREKPDDVSSHLIGVIGNVIYGLRLRGIDYKQFLFSFGLFRKLVYLSPYVLGDHLKSAEIIF